MQWLIDLIIEALGIPPCFVGLDQLHGTIVVAGLIIDGNWHELDVSQDLPATGVTGVNVHLTGETTNVGDIIYLRSPIDIGTYSTCALRPPVANVTVGERRVIGLTPTRKLEYKFLGVGWTQYKIHIRGYFK